MEITLDRVTKVYEGATSAEPALSGVSARVASGEFFFLLGPSGCGKTTLLRLIAGLIKPTSGRILFDERDVTDLPVDKRDAALVFQGYALWPHMSVRANVEFGPKMRGVPSDERRRRAMEQLRRVQMEAYADRKPNELSGGQQQRVALARALAAGTECILLDEPLSSLDARLRLHMRDELRSLVKSSGVTAVYVTHDQKEALSMADRVAVMNAGRIVQIGTAEEVYVRPATHFVADFLGEANFLEGRVREVGMPSRIETSLGDILCANGRELAAGTAVTCCVRPELIRIEGEGGAQGGGTRGAGGAARSEGGENCLRATVTSSIYLGDVRQYVCALEGEGGSWRVEQLAGQRHLSPGDRVNLRFAADRVAVLAS